MLGIVIILLTALMTALIQSRQSAQSIQCKNNLRQFGLALQNYLDSFGVYPPGYFHQTQPDEVGNQSGFGWGALLLPYSSQRALYETLDFSVPLWDDVNAPARTTRIPNYICPSDVASEDGFLNSDGQRYAHSSYVGNFGPGLMDVNPLDIRGVFGRNSSTGTEQVVDGLSNTLFIGERMNGLLPNPSSALGLGFAGPLDHFETTWAGAAQDRTNPANENPHWVLFQSGHLPQSPNSDFRDASSGHAGGAHFLLGDGAVRFLSKNINEEAYRGMSTRAGGELVNDF